MKRIVSIVALAAMVMLGLLAQAQAATPPARKIPGINAPDAFPGGCVDCHVAKPGGQSIDARLSTHLAAWTAGKVDPALLATVQATAPAGLKLKGKHPDAEDALDDVPAACADCHSEDSKKAPPLDRMVHRIHLVGGDKNHYLTEFQGDCTNCHKFDAAEGAWSMPSGPEKK